MSEIRPRLSVQFELFNNNHFKTLLLKYFNPQLYSAHLNNFSHLENILMAGSYPADCDMVLAMFSVWWGVRYPGELDCLHYANNCTTPSQHQHGIT